MTGWLESWHWLKTLNAEIYPLDIENSYFAESPGEFPLFPTFPATIKVANNLCLDFDFEFSLPTDWTQYGNIVSGRVLYIQVEFETEHRSYRGRVYYYLKPVSEQPSVNYAFGVNCSGLTHFTRNLYDDYVSVYGAPSGGEDLFIRKLSISSSLNFNYPGSQQTQIVDVDNIALKRINNPEVTSATQG